MRLPSRRLLAGLGATLLSVAGVSSILTHEGRSLVAYPDPATHGAPWTICDGHTGADVYSGLRVTDAQCDLWFAVDTAVAESAVQGLVRVPLRQGEYDAYTEFVFNAGRNNFRTSTMLRLLNTGDHTAACNQFPRWVYAAGKKLPGLVSRRAEQQTVCLTQGRIVYVPR